MPLQSSPTPEINTWVQCQCVRRFVQFWAENVWSVCSSFYTENICPLIVEVTLLRTARVDQNHKVLGRRPKELKDAETLQRAEGNLLGADSLCGLFLSKARWVMNLLPDKGFSSWSFFHIQIYFNYCKTNDLLPWCLERGKKSTEVKKLQQHLQYIEQLYKTSMNNTADYSGLSQVCLHEEPFALNNSYVIGSEQL